MRCPNKLSWLALPLTGFHSCGRDLAESRRLEAALAASELFARATIDARSGEIRVLDATGTTVARNRALKKIFTIKPVGPPVLP